MKIVYSVLFFLCILILNPNCKKEECGNITTNASREQIGPNLYKYSVDPEGGTIPYLYAWSTGESTATITKDDQTSHISVTITDGNLCTKVFEFMIPFLCDTSILDTENNFYPVANIDNHCWMAKNLRYALNDVSDSLEWTQKSVLKTPAICEVNNDTTTAVRLKFGYLYNWYAIDLNPCPLGWHVPTVDEYRHLINSLGGESVAGAALKSTDPADWDVPNTGATNITGFSAVGAGDRSNQGLIESFLKAGIYWTSSVNDVHSAYYVIIFHNGTSAIVGTQNKSHGYSCRCVKN